MKPPLAELVTSTASIRPGHCWTPLGRRDHRSARRGCTTHRWVPEWRQWAWMTVTTCSNSSSWPRRCTALFTDDV